MARIIDVTHRVLGRRARPAEPSWVSKSDVVGYLRCPYAFWQLDQGLVAPAAALDAIGAQLVADGNHFHTAVAEPARPLDDAEPVTVLDDPARLREALAGTRVVHGLPVLEHPGLRLYGIPDAIDPAGGALAPIEIKSHRAVQRSDELELCFYWRLLEPLRTHRDAPPRGRLVLRRDQEPVEIEIELTAARFAELDELIAAVRAARRDGVRARVCGCTVCSGPLREQIARSTRDGHDLTLLFGIGRVTAGALEAEGIGDYDALSRRDPGELVALLRRYGLYRSPAQVRAWIEHAASYRTAQPTVFGAPPAVGDAFIALDLEYDPFVPHVWLTGLLVVDENHHEHIALWADTPEQERHAVETAAAVCAAHPNLPVLTWAGTSADLPKLRAAAERHQLTRAIDAIQARHLDLYAHAQRTVRLPIPELALGAVAEYFALTHTSPIRNGIEAQMRYGQYSASTDPARRATLRAELTAYNLADLEGLAGVLAALQALHTGQHPPALAA